MSTMPWSMLCPHWLDKILLPAISLSHWHCEKSYLARLRTHKAGHWADWRERVREFYYEWMNDFPPGKRTTRPDPETLISKVVKCKPFLLSWSCILILGSNERECQLMVTSRRLCWEKGLPGTSRQADTPGTRDDQTGSNTGDVILVSNLADVPPMRIME